MTSQQPGTWKWVITVPCSCWCHTTDSAVPSPEEERMNTEAIDGQPVCSERVHDCRCRENAGHHPETPHRCPCGGAWNGTDGEVTEVVEWPGGGMAGALTLAATGQLRADDEDW